ncbi:DUF2062 domain-containing protein [Sphingomonas sp.]|uniref:DUF2062 domain-containing protein n=1 Tax=Sphingomonas sp. TaxID=28214 RepID=UPI00286A2713|nr:DUF2062 domain-containing protein [Sphingomonas sp.]
MADDETLLGSRWLRHHIPTRETVQQNRILRPFARHLSDPALWRLTRRSVPRAVALGLGVGVIIPIMHVLIAALLAIPLRANVAIAAACTLVINPLTIPPLYYAAYRIGSWELHHNGAVINHGAAEQVSGELSRVLFWIHHASGPIALGVVTIALGAAVIGYGITAILWRRWLSSKWRARRHARRAAK